MSQWLAAHRASISQIDAAFCSADGLTQSLVQTVMQDASNADMHHGQAADHDAHGNACDYCSLLANHPPLAMPSHGVAVSFAWIARAGPAATVSPQTLPLAHTPPVRAPPFAS